MRVEKMVQPSARASHILVKSKGEAVSLSSNISKLKEYLSDESFTGFVFKC